MKKAVPEGYTELAADDIDSPEEGGRILRNTATVVRLPSFEQVEADSETYARASRVLHRESNPGNARALVQRHGDRELWVTPPPIPLTMEEMDRVYELPYARGPHPSYADQKIPAWEMIRHSVTIMRGCFGGCTFCSITEHEGRIIQSRSEDSILREIEQIRDKDADLHRLHLRHRRPNRQHVPHGLQRPRNREGLPPPIVRLSRHLPQPEHQPRRADQPLPQGARAARHQEGARRIRRALRPRGREPGLRQGARHPSRRRLSQDRARAHRGRAALQDDEARHRQLRALQAAVRRSRPSRPARSSS